MSRQTLQQTHDRHSFPQHIIFTTSNCRVALQDVMLRYVTRRWNRIDKHIRARLIHNW